jgi:hypothetical protein
MKRGALRAPKHLHRCSLSTPVAVDGGVWHPAGCEWGSKEDIHEAPWRYRCA